MCITGNFCSNLVLFEGCSVCIICRFRSSLMFLQRSLHSIQGSGGLCLGCLQGLCVRLRRLRICCAICIDCCLQGRRIDACLRFCGCQSLGQLSVSLARL